MHKAADEGYLILATGPAQYVSMARNLAVSIRFMDGTRRICLMHDEDFRPDASDITSSMITQRSRTMRDTPAS